MVGPGGYKVQCGEIWGGIRNDDLDVQTSALTASLYASAADGGKGGDIYYFSVCGADVLTRIALADVVGHGQAASAVSEWLYTALVEHMGSHENHGVLTRLNRLAVEHSFRALTTAAVAGIVRVEGQLEFAYAGHPPVMIRQRDGWRALQRRESADVAGPLANIPLGVAPETRYEQQSEPLHPGDQLFFYTDGVLEATDRDGETFGERRLRAVLERERGAAPAELKHRVLEALRDFARGDLSHDDITVLAVEISDAVKPGESQG